MNAKQKWIETNMKTMGWTAEEAEDVWNADHAIDKGEAMDFDLTEEQEKNASEMTRTTQAVKPTRTKSATPRKVKIDQTKRNLIQILFDAIQPQTIGAMITKEEREISFVLGEDTYTVTLTKHRAKKGE